MVFLREVAIAAAAVGVAYFGVTVVLEVTAAAAVVVSRFPLQVKRCSVSPVRPGDSILGLPLWLVVERVRLWFEAGKLGTYK